MVRKIFGALAVALVATLLAGTMFGSMASSQEPDHSEVTTPLDTKGGLVSPDGLVVFGTDVTCPAQPLRKLDATQSAAFVESFLAEAIFGTPVLQNPPTDLAVCKADITWINGSPTKTVQTMKYATDGTKAWLLFVGTNVWFVGGPRVKGSIEGRLKPFKTWVDPTAKLKVGTKTETKTETRTSDDEKPWALIVGAGVAVGALLVGAAVWAKRRTAGGLTGADEPDSDDLGTDQPDRPDDSV